MANVNLGPGKISFRDAKGEEFYMGDVFLRDGELSYCTADCSDTATVSAAKCYSDAGISTLTTTCDCNINALSSAIGYNSVKGDTGWSSITIDAVSKDDFSTIQDGLKKLQAEIEKLKQNKSSTTKLRGSLKTLQYKRELE